MLSDRNFEIRPEYRNPEDPGPDFLTPGRVFRFVMGSMLTGFLIVICWSIYVKEATWRYSATNPNPSTSTTLRTERPVSKQTSLSLPKAPNRSPRSNPNPRCLQSMAVDLR